MRRRLRRRPTQWFYTEVNETIGTLTVNTEKLSAVTLINSADLFSQGSQPTIARIRGTLWMAQTRANQDNTFIMTVQLGIHCVDPAMPSISPRTSGDDESWMFMDYGEVRTDNHEYVNLNSSNAEVEYSRNRPTYATHQFLIDSHAMRKAEDPCELRLMHSAKPLSTAATDYQLRGFLRVLVME